jgi:hypothetical protein
MRVRYRPQDTDRWLLGRTENVSRSGVLFEAEQLLDIDSLIELQLMLPGADGGASDVLCLGRIVRQIEPPTEGARPSLAATIEEYRFGPRSDES